MEGWEEALSSFERALEINPSLHEGWENRGMMLGNLGDYEEAITSFDYALQLKPDYHQTWKYRGIILRELGRWEEAVANFEKANAQDEIESTLIAIIQRRLPPADQERSLT